MTAPIGYDATQFPEYASTKGRMRVELTHIGEGYSGDFDPDDSEDAPLYRVDVTFRGRDEDDMGTYCTLIVCGLNTDYKALTKRLVEYADQRRKAGDSLRQIAAGISWMSNNDLTDHLGGAA